MVVVVEDADGVGTSRVRAVATCLRRCRRQSTRSRSCPLRSASDSDTWYDMIGQWVVVGGKSDKRVEEREKERRNVVIKDRNIEGDKKDAGREYCTGHPR